MKKILLTLLAALSTLGPGKVCSAQEETPAKVKLYGFIRNYMVFDTHEVNAGTQDLYFYMPKDSKMSEDGIDLAEVPTFRMLALTTRLGLNVSGYRIGEKCGRCGSCRPSRSARRPACHIQSSC